MRNNLTLLTIMRDHIVEYNYVVGLCITAGYEELNFTDYERMKIKRYITKHRPSTSSELYLYYTITGYYWRQNEVKPRLDWLNHHIKLLTKSS